MHYIVEHLGDNTHCAVYGIVCSVLKVPFIPTIIFFIVIHVKIAVVITISSVGTIDLTVHPIPQSYPDKQTSPF